MQATKQIQNEDKVLELAKMIVAQINISRSEGHLVGSMELPKGYSDEQYDASVTLLNLTSSAIKLKCSFSKDGNTFKINGDYDINSLYDTDETKKQLLNLLGTKMNVYKVETFTQPSLTNFNPKAYLSNYLAKKKSAHSSDAAAPCK